MRKKENCPACRWRRRKEARPSEILDAALSLFTRRGFSSTTLDQVAKAAGISKGTLYLYYNNKEDLFRSMVTEILVPHVEQFEKQALEFDGPAADLLRNMSHGWWHTVGDSPLSSIPKLMIAEEANFPELAKYFVDTIIVRARKLVADILQRGIDRGELRECETDLTARLVLAPLVFAAIWKDSLGRHDKPYSINNYIDLHVDMILQGLAK